MWILNTPLVLRVCCCKTTGTSLSSQLSAWFVGNHGASTHCGGELEMQSRQHRQVGWIDQTHDTGINWQFGWRGCVDIGGYWCTWDLWVFCLPVSTWMLIKWINIVQQVQSWLPDPSDTWLDAWHLTQGETLESSISKHHRYRSK